MEAVETKQPEETGEELEELIELKGVTKKFPYDRSFFGYKQSLTAVNDITLKIYPGETLALVGESGCGKTTTGRLILDLEELSGGQITYKGKVRDDFTAEDWQQYRQEVQVIFQDSNSSLNPRKTVKSIIRSALICSGLYRRKDKEKISARIIELLNDVGLRPPEKFMSKYPNELSGGQRQRIGIARALATEPELVVADEPVSALDVSVKSQVLATLQKLQQEKNLAYLFISHELTIVHSVADRIAVMYLGKIVELGTNKNVFEKAIHPYTESLISATPIPNPRETREKERIILKGSVPSPKNPPRGCYFHPRCFYAKDICNEKAPELETIFPGHQVACHFARERMER